MSKIKTMATKLVGEVRTYWNKPKPGEYVSYKEFSSYVVGTSGSNSVVTALSYITFTAGCTLIGKIYELPLSFFAILGILGIPMSYIAAPINMLITDNLGKFDKKRLSILNCICIPLAVIGIGLYFVDQKPLEHIMPALPQIAATIITSSVFNIYYRMIVLNKLAKKFGKFRPFIITGAIPLLIVAALIVYLPFRRMDIIGRFWILHLLFSYFNIFLSFANQTAPLANVISPSSDERAKIMGIGGFAFSLVPSLVAILLPFFAQLAGGFESMITYQVVIPVFVLLLTGMTMFAAFGCKEKVIVSKVHQAKISFSDGAKHVLTNKNFLMTNFSGFFGCLSQGALALNSILFIYIARNSAFFGVYAGIIGTACIPGLLMAPWLIKKFGKKRLVLFARVFMVAGSLLNWFAMALGSLWIFIIINYLLQIISMPANIASAAMNADIWDELQLKSGMRLDGMTGIFGLLQTPFYALAGMIFPAVYLTMGFSSDWNILFVPEFRMPLINFTIIMGTLVAALGAIPMLFYDLSEKKHKQIIEKLKSIANDEGGYNDHELEESAELETEVLMQVDGLLAQAEGTTSDSVINTDINALVNNTPVTDFVNESKDIKTDDDLSTTADVIDTDKDKNNN